VILDIAPVLTEGEQSESGSRKKRYGCLVGPCNKFKPFDALRNAFLDQYIYFKK
jgi:hypothetical protein